MDHHISSNPVNSLSTFLAGAALGGAVVALITPKRGSELRKDLTRLGDKAKDQMGDWSESMSEAVEGIKATASEMATKATGRVKAKAEEVADKGVNAWKEVNKDAANAGSELKEGFTSAGKALRA